MKHQYQKLELTSAVIIFLLASFAFGSGALASTINANEVAKLINQARDDQGRMELAENDKLDKVAGDKLNDMITYGYFAHTSPKGVGPWYWFQKEGYDYRYAGENLAINFTRAEDEQDAWMGSPLHRQNILDDNYQEIGVAVGAGEINGQMSLIVVTEFGSRDGVAVNNQKNFSGNGKTDLVGDQKKIPPTVLSVNDSNGPENNIGAGGEGQNNFGQYTSTVLGLDWLLLILASIVALAVFLKMAFSRVLENDQDGHSIAVKFMDNINESRLIKVNLM